MIKVKFCGLRRLADIEYSNELMTDYAGFVFAESKRKVTIKAAAYLASKLDKRIKKVGVFVNEKEEIIQNIIDEVGLDVVQLHGSETYEQTQNLGVEVWKAIKMKGKESIEEAKKYRCRLLLDSFSDKAGGSGRTFDLNLLKSNLFIKNFVLAGGLNESNVTEILDVLKSFNMMPYAVDVSSGIETNGEKDYLKMKEFLERVRSYE